MRRSAAGLVALLLAGCIPQVEQDYRASRLPPRGEAPPQDDRYPPQPYEPPVERQDDERVPPAPRRPRGPAPTQAYPAARPAWEARPASPDAVTVAASVYGVQPGDTLARVADRTGAGIAAIAQANGLAPPYAIEPGQRLTIPGGRYHTVHPGEAGIAIARAYGIAWSKIVAANGLAEPFTLRVGERILIPGTPTGTNRLAERAAAFSLNIDDILTGGEPAPSRGEEAPVRPVDTPTRVLPPSAIVAAPARLRGGFVWPVDGSIGGGRIVGRFGPGGTGQRNDGIKIAVPSGTPVHAAADGVVAYVGDGIAALGGLVIVKHGDNWTSVYGHASRLLVQRGQAVKQGQTIALSGATGYADRPELHFELRKGRAPIDPVTQLPRR